MDLDSFIRKYRPEWDRLEEAVRRGRLASLPGPRLDEAVRLYLRTSGHLAEAQGRYRDPSLVAYLTGLVARAHGAIYGTRSRSLSDALSAVGGRYRRAVRETAPFIWISAALFVAVTALVLAWVGGSPHVRAGLLPPEAREAIREFGGERADFGVGAGALSTLILLNNIQVAFLGFALGVTAGVGTVAVLLLNAVNIGVIAGAFGAAGKGAAFWALVLPHGLLELTAIFIACGAGLRIGWALVEPGDRRRSAALAHAAGRAVLVVAGVVPAFVVAGLIEGYVSGTAVPVPLQLAIGAGVWAAYLAFLGWPDRRPRYRRE